MITISRTGVLLRGLVRASCRWPVLTVLVSLALAALGIAYTVSALDFKTSTLHLLPPGLRYATLYAEYARDFGELEDIVVVVQGRTLEESKAYAARLVRELRLSPVTFKRLSYRIDPKRFEGRALLYLSLDELKEIRDKIFDHQELLESFAAEPTLDRLIDGINRQIAAAFLTRFFDLGLQDGAPADLRFLRDLLTQISERVGQQRPYRSPWGSLFSFVRTEEADSGYFLSDDKSLLFVLVEPASDAGSFTSDRAAIDVIRERIATLRRDFPGVQAGVTGPPTLSNDEMVTAFRDSELATILAFTLTLALLVLAFRRVRTPLLMLAVLAVSLAWSLGVITLVVGHLTIFSVMFISIVVGIGIDYGIYLLFRYEEEIALGRGLQEALQVTAARSGPGIVLGALTGAGTFYVLMFTDFHGIREFGFVAGTAILLAFLGMLTFFPALLVLEDWRRAAGSRGAPSGVIELGRVRVRSLERLARHPKSVLVAAGLFTGFSLWTVRAVGFDYNLLNLQARGTESVLWEKKILATAERSGFTALATASSLGQLRDKHAAFEQLPSVSEVDSVLMLIPEDQPEKIKVIRDFAPLVAPVRVGRPQSFNLDLLAETLRTLGRRFDVAVSEAGPEGPGREIEGVRSQIATLQDKLSGADREVVEPALGHLQAQLYADFLDKFHAFQRNLRPGPVTLNDVPEDLRRRFIGRSARFLIQIHPKVNIWDREGATRFVEELRSVDPDVTGPAVLTYESIRRMETAYRQGALYALALVAVLAALMIRRLRETALALVPLVLGVLWTVGLMYAFDLRFNLANVWGLPLIIGAAAEYGLNVVVRFMEGRAHGGPLMARSTVMAVLFNGLTTIGGFGSLLVAHHQGIWSLGLLLTIGTSASLVASLIVLPVLLRAAGGAVAPEGRGGAWPVGRARRVGGQRP